MKCLAIALTLLTAGCTLGPDFTAPEATLPATWAPHRDAQAASAAAPEPVDAAWWRRFGDPELTRLVDRVAAENFDVRTAGFRLAQSRAQRGVTAADLLPSLNGNGSYTREKPSAQGVTSLIGNSGSTQSNGLGGRQGGLPLGSVLNQPFDLYQGGFDASWEIDLWGKVRREVESADASLAASAEQRRDTLVSMMAELARDYLQLRGVQEQMRVTRANLDSARETARLTHERTQGGLATDLDAANADAEQAEIDSQLPPLEQQQASLVNAIGFLLGQQPGSLTAELVTDVPSPAAPPSVPVGVPSELVRRRPDIRQAEANLHVATADIGVAQADFYPQVTLSASAALQAVAFKNLGDWGARTYGAGPAISLPIFDGGRRASTLELRKAAQQEAAVTFQRTVLNAWREVDDALEAYTDEQRRSVRLAAQAANASRAVGLATARFARGLATYLDVLTAQRSALSAEATLATSKATVNTDLVALYKALGGGWETAFPETAAVSDRPTVPDRATD